MPPDVSNAHALTDRWCPNGRGTPPAWVEVMTHPSILPILLAGLVAQACSIALDGPAPKHEPKEPLSESGLAAAGVAPPSIGPTILFEELQGPQPAQARAVYSKAGAALQECAKQGGTIRVSVKGEGERARYSIEPGSALDPSQRRCVLEALSVVDVDSVLQTANPTDRPSNFTGLIRIEW